MNLNLKTKDLKTNKGITLIALVITIIVLLILAGVTIVTLTGDNGLITKANTAKNANLEAEEKEKIRLGYNEFKIKKYTDINPILTVEGATVTGDETNGWNIEFAQNQYTLSSDGTIKTPITNPYDENGWEYAYTCTNGEWSDMITKGNTAEGDIIAKFYKQDTLITPSNLIVRNFPINDTIIRLDIPFSENYSYHLVIEGTGEMGKLAENMDFTTCTAWQILSMNYLAEYLETGNIPEDIVPLMQYVTEIYVCDGVTNIADNSFFAAHSLNNISISYSVTSIGDFAINCCRNLRSIIIPDNVTSIGNNAFFDCTNLRSITIPNRVISIGNEALGGCENLTSITIPNSVTSIGSGAFYEWTSSQIINIRASSIPDTWDEGWNRSCNANIVTGYTGK